MKHFAFLLFFLSINFAIAAQNHNEYYDPYAREPLPEGGPEWLKRISDNPSRVNFFEMEALFDAWLAADSDARVKTIEKKPTVNFYRRWARAYRPLVNQKGEIVLPLLTDYFAKLDAQNADTRRKARPQGYAASSAAAKSWRPIGPFTTVSDKAGRPVYDSQACVFRIDVAPSDHNTVYSGAETGVMFKTTDKGANWNPCNGAHNFGGAIYAIKVHPTDKNTVFVGGGEALWKTTDGGNTWTRVIGIFSRVNSIRFSPANPQRLTVSAESGFYTSSNGGATFSKVLSGLCHDHELKPGDPNTVYLLMKPDGTDFYKFYISTNGGSAFTETPMMDYIKAGRLAVSEAPGGADYVYALVNVSDNPADYGYLYGGAGVPHILKSTDAGRTWTDKTTRETNYWNNTFSPIIDDDRGGQGYFDMMIGVSNKNPEHVIFGLCSSYRSTAGGEGSYRATAIGGYQKLDNMHPDMQDIAVAGDDTWITTDGGIKYSADFFATKGEDRNKGFYASDYFGFGQGWNDDVMAGGRWHNGDAVHAASYGEGNTVWVGGVEYPTGHVMMSNPRKVYFSDAGMHTIPQDINGTFSVTYNEQFQDKKPYESLRSNGFIATDPRYAHRLIINSRDGDYSSQGEIYKLYESLDEGRTFRMILDTEGQAISNVEFARSNPDYIYATGIYDIYRSTDNGKTWNELSKRPFGTNYYTGNPVSILAVHPHDENTLWITQTYAAGRVVYTTDGGATWTNPLSGDLLNKAFYWIILTGDDLNGVYLGATDENKVYYKDDSMSEWVDYSDGLNPGARLTRLVPFYKEGKLRAATNQGVWEIPLYRETFRPTAQPMALNIGDGNLTAIPAKEVQFDSYSIINQNSAAWQWTFSPQPQSVSGADTRSPKVIFGKNGAYDVTLTATTPQGAHTRTMKRMITIGDASTGQTAAEEDNVKVYPTALKSGETLRVETRGLNDEKRFTLHNAKGHLLQKHYISAAENTLSVSTAGLAPGVYIYELRTATYKRFGKIVVQ